MSLLRQSTARNRLFIMVSSVDHLAPKTGAAPVVNLSKNGAAFGAAAGAVTEIANGFYQVALTTVDTSTLGDLAFHVTGTGADPTQFVDQVVAFDPTDAAALGLSRVDAAITSRATPAQILTTPANLLATDGTGRVTVGTNADKAGYSLSTAPPTVTQIWSEPVPAAYATGSAGNKLGNLSGAAGSGALTVTVTIQNDATHPVQGASAWVTTDSGGTNVVASGTTDTFGHVTFFLNAGSYYLWASKPGESFTNPTAITVS